MPAQASEPLVAVPGPLDIKWRPAHRRNYTAHRPGPIQFLVIHCTDGCEGIHKDDDVARMFARSDLARKRSCHYVCDTDSITQCVPDVAKAWHCGRKGNAGGLGLELCGRARQTREQWLDELSLPMLAIAARWAAVKCERYHLPPVFVSAEGLLKGEPGITTHAEVGKAWRQTTHTDPGPHFPMDLFLKAVQTAMAAESRV